MANAIINGLQMWQSDASCLLISATDWVNDLVDHQSKLGWRNFFEGMIESKWQIAQQVYLSWIGSWSGGPSQSLGNCGRLLGICGNTGMDSYIPEIQDFTLKTSTISSH
jgi:hypothetical protein